MRSEKYRFYPFLQITKNSLLLLLAVLATATKEFFEVGRKYSTEIVDYHFCDNAFIQVR